MEISKSKRCELARKMARSAGMLGMTYFGRLETLKIDKKGHQDLVSEADKALEEHIRLHITDAFPDDSILGEEDGFSPGKNDYVWVIDPIDGTANFVAGIPAWTVVIALVKDFCTIAGFIYDPIQDELYTAYVGEGAWCNDKKLSVTSHADIMSGSIAVGFSNRSKPDFISKLVTSIIGEGGVFFRNASGALSLTYVASGKLLGYSEDHMNAWDYLAGQLMVAEAGGSVETQDVKEVLEKGGRVVVSAPPLFTKLLELTKQALI